MCSLEVNSKPPVPYEYCGSPQGELVKLHFIPPCEKDACILQRGREVTLLVNFKSLVNTKTLQLNGFISEFGQFIEFRVKKITMSSIN